MSEASPVRPDLEATLQRLESFGVRLGLETTHRLLRALGDPQSELRCVLVAGTNGKGSTAALLAGMATMAGYSTGLYTSPHLESVEERLRIDGVSVPTHELNRLVVDIVRTAEDQLGYLPTYFEALTAAAFQWFAESRVDLAVLEVGLGGRLDATNGADPILSLITEVGLDHRQHLGETIDAIAREKAGILRAERPAIAWTRRTEARRAIQQVADEVGARLEWGPDRARIRSWSAGPGGGQSIELETPTGVRALQSPLLGEHQRDNLALAVLAAEALAAQGFDRLTGEGVSRGAARLRWPGRMEWVELPTGERFLLDVAHNPDGGRRLAVAVADLGGRFDLLFGALADKEVDQFLPGLTALARRVILTSPVSPRALAPEKLVPLIVDKPRLVEPDPAIALTSALSDTADFLVVCGSVYLVGEIRSELRRRFGVPLPATAELLPGSRSRPQSTGG